MGKSKELSFFSPSKNDAVTVHAPDFAALRQALCRYSSKSS